MKSLLSTSLLQTIQNHQTQIKNVILVFVLFISVSGLSQEKKNKNAKYDIEVSGNCDLCKKRIEKAAYSVKGVKSAEYHLDDNLLHLIINEEKCTLLQIETAVAKVGHDTQNVKATQEDYDNLHSCCKYTRKE